MTKLQKRLKKANDFLKEIEQRIEKDKGAKADLKRALSGEPRHLLHIYPIVRPELEYSDNEEQQRFLEYRQQHIWIPVVCLFSYYPPKDHRYVEQRHFGYSCRVLNEKTDSNGPERRFRTLLETDLENLLPLLATLVRLMKQKEVAINYPQLIVDLEQWSHYKMYIQDQWAKAFWRGDSSKTDNAAADSDDSDAEASAEAST